MTRVSELSFGRTIKNGLLLVLTCALTACTTPLDLGAINLAKLVKDGDTPVAPYSRGKLEQRWAATPDALVMVQRGNSSEKVQLIGLENSTTMEGDNFLWLRAHNERDAEFDLDKLMQEVGTVPYPFTSLNYRDLRSREDSLGSYCWKEWRSGSQTNCVVAFRRLDSGALNLPNGSRSLDVFLRNCVAGSMEEALQPVSDDWTGRSTFTNAAGVNSNNRSLSPLAGPRR